MADGVLKKVLLSYAYVAIWIFLSFTVIVYNKYILYPKMYGWPFPISLTMIHMAFCSAIAFLVVCVLRLVEAPSSPSMTRAFYLSSVIPIGALYSLSVWFSIPHTCAILNLIVKEWHGKTHSILVVVVFVFCVICVLYFKNLWYNDSDVNSVG